MTSNYDTWAGFDYEIDGSYAPCTGATLTPNPASPEPVTTPVTFTGTAASCGTPQYEFWELAPGTGWTIVQPWGAPSTYAWDTTSASAGDYSFEVWTRDVMSTANYDSYAGVTYTLQ
jgi:hypothetical protein